MIAKMLASRFAATSVDGYSARSAEMAKLWGLNKPAASGADVNTRTVIGLSPIFRAANIIGNDVRKCKPLIYQRMTGSKPDPQGRDKRRAIEHPSWRATVRRANQWMSAGEVRKTATINAMLSGNGVCWIDRADDGSVLEYLPLLPDRTGMGFYNATFGENSDVPKDGELLYWTIIRGEMFTILPENVMHIRGLSHNGVWGIDVIEIMRETLGLAIAARDCGARFYGQGMLGSGVLYMPPGLGKGPKSEEIVANFIKRIRDQAQGLSRAHRLMVIDDGSKFEKLSVDPEAAQALQTREFEIEELANIAGCQAHKLGSKARKSYASLEQSNQEHADDDIDPWLTSWEESLEDAVLTEEEKESGSHFVECNRKALLRTNLAARTSYYTAGRNGGWLSANDVLRSEGEDPIGDQGDIYLVPANMTPADQAGAAFDVVPQNDGSSSNDDNSEESDPNASRLAGDFGILAMHECTRLIDRTCAEAVRKAAKGGVEFIAFLDSIPKQCQEPAPLRPLLKQVGEFLHAGLSEFTESPYAANDLKTNIAGAVDDLRGRAARAAEIYYKVERLATNHKPKAAA